MFTILDNDEALAANPQSRWMQTDLDAIIAGMAGTGFVSGCAVTAQGVPDMTVAVAAGVIKITGVAASVVAANVTVTAAHASLPRVDLIVADEDGALACIAGTAATNAKAPAAPADTVLLAMVYVPAAASSISSTYLTDKRVPGGLPLSTGVDFESADLGPNLVTNGTFTGSATGWTLGAGWAYGANAVTHTPGSTATLEQDPLGGVALIVGRTYVVSVEVTASTVGELVVTVGGADAFTIDGTEGADTYTAWLVASSTAGLIATPDTDYDGTLDNVSVQLVPEPLATSWNLPYAETETQNWRWAAVVDGGSGYLAAQWGNDAGDTWGDRLRLFSGVGGALSIASDNLSYESPEDVNAEFVFATSGTGDARIQLETDGGEFAIIFDAAGLATIEGATGYTFDAATRLVPVAIADLHATPTAGMLQTVNDALVPVLGNTVAAGGAAYALVTFNGSNWTVSGK